MSVLHAVAHGTRSPAGQAQIKRLAERVAATGIDIRLSYVDVQTPRFAGAHGDDVVVPLLLSSGYHVRVDIAAACTGAVTAPLGPDPALIDIMLQRLPAADAVVFAAAGSSDPRSHADVTAAAQLLAQRLPVPVHVAYTATCEPRVDQVVAALRRRHRRIAVAAYFLADGLFYRRLHDAGADAVTEPLATHPGTAELVVDRYLTTAATPL
jgi:sirohydrochlorin ferrochelatase